MPPVAKPCGVFVTRKVPDSAVDGVVQGFQDQGAAVAQQQQPDGTWTVTADFGPCPDKSNPTTTTTHGA